MLRLSYKRTQSSSAVKALPRCDTRTGCLGPTPTEKCYNAMESEVSDHAGRKGV